MDIQLVRSLVSLAAAIVLIVLLTARYRVHAFFALFLACFVVGAGAHLGTGTILGAMKEGFGKILQSLGMIIVLGTALGVVLEYTSGTRVMADFILGKVGEKRASLAMSVIGFIVGLPIFCDSGFIVLSGLGRSLARRVQVPVSVISVSLASGLYSIHCMAPPHPGAAAAAGVIGVEFGQLLLAGMVVAIPAAWAGHLWARYAGRMEEDRSGGGWLGGPAEDRRGGLRSGKEGFGEKEAPGEKEARGEKEAQGEKKAPPGEKAGPSVGRAFLPVLVPILLIAAKSFLVFEHTETGVHILRAALSFLGEPVIALSAGLLLAFCGGQGWNRAKVGGLLQDSVEKAGGILVIIGAGGAFGAVLAATDIGTRLSETAPLASMGILFPFILSALLKTAQGSSTVAIITAASIVNPLLPALGLEAGHGHLLCVLAMGAGSMMVSHANDAYFWVIARFSGLTMRTMLRVYTVATIFMGLVAFGMVCLLSKIL